MTRRHLATIVFLACCSPAFGEVTVYLKNGQKLVGESIVKDDEQSLEVKICHSFSRTIPKAAIEKYVDAPATQPAKIEAATQPAARTQWSAEEEARAGTLIDDFFGQPERRAAILAEARRNDAVPRQEVAGLSRLAMAKAREGLKLREGDFVFDDPRYKGNVHVEVRRAGAGAATRPTTAATKQADDARLGHDRGDKRTR